MHTIAWKAAEGVERWYVNDGLFRLPETATAEAVVVVGDRGLLIDRNSSAPLRAGQALTTARGPDLTTLTWEPDSTPRPRDLDTEPTRHEPHDARVPALRLRLENGDAHSLGTQPLLVGRHPACGVRLNDPKVSSLHCLVVLVDDGARVLDLQSRNGTIVNGARIKDVVLRRAATLKVGSTRLSIEPVAHSTEQITLTSPAMLGVYDMISRVAPADAPVLLLGESGTGKDGLAEMIHRKSGRFGRYIPLNAAAITPTLAASELFGHIQGAFTGADRDKDGAFMAAEGGTLFLDEIADLPLTVQAELLRAVEQRMIHQVGDHRELAVSARLIVATNRNLVAEVEAGRFREDLFHRLCVVPITVPPLRDRPEDLEALANHFLHSVEPQRRLSQSAWASLRSYRWPGNVRELGNVIRRAAILTDREEIDADDLRIGFGFTNPSVERLIHERVLEVYAKNCASVAETARILGMRRAAVYRHLRIEKQRQTTPEAKAPRRRRH